jgi:hypothetical protein
MKKCRHRMRPPSVTNSLGSIALVGERDRKGLGGNSRCLGHPAACPWAGPSQARSVGLGGARC